MGIYLNVGTEGFEAALRSGYVDKTAMIAGINRTIGTSDKLTLISRPRRFGKSTAAKMLAAYYDKYSEASALFDEMQISGDPSYREHLNRYDVIYLDISNLIGKTDYDSFITFACGRIIDEIKKAYPEVETSDILDEVLLNTVLHTGNKFVMIIDEWDVIFRTAGVKEQTKQRYLDFLRSLFKSSSTTDRIFAAAYMTGILPVKKDGTQSAVSEFREYTMLDAAPFEAFVGFTENDVRDLCVKNNVSFELMKQWYDGYHFPSTGSVYNPDSVMSAIRKGQFRSYWKASSAADNLLNYLNMDYDSLADTAVLLLADRSVTVDTADFRNDMFDLRSANDVLTLLIHFGYLSYDHDSGTACIPNDEIRQEFASSIRQVTHADTIRRVKESDQLIRDTAYGNEDAVAAQIEKVHMEETSPLNYNREEALRGVIKIAYFSYRDEYIRFEELPSGNGYADVVYLPKKHSDYPALVIELKWNKDAESAITQIKNRNYPQVLENYGAEILLVGISYDKEDGAKKHHCRIERFRIGES